MIRKRNQIGGNIVKPATPKTKEASRVARHRKRIAADGAQRVEVTVPSRDAPLVKAVAGALRSGGEEAQFVRRALQPVLHIPQARKGADLIAFLRASPLVEAELPIERDRSTGRVAEFD